MTESPDLSVIIVNWNSAEFVRKCLASVFRQKSSLLIEAIVIDNGSRDGCGEMIAAEFPGVSFLQSDSNLGFAQANNIAFTKSNGRLLLFLNPDTEVNETAIERMAAVLDGVPDAWCRRREAFELRFVCANQLHPEVSDYVANIHGLECPENIVSSLVIVGHAATVRSTPRDGRSGGNLGRVPDDPP